MRSRVQLSEREKVKKGKKKNEQHHRGFAILMKVNNYKIKHTN